MVRDYSQNQRDLGEDDWAEGLEDDGATIEDRKATLRLLDIHHLARPVVLVRLHLRLIAYFVFLHEDVGADTRPQYRMNFRMRRMAQSDIAIGHDAKQIVVSHRCNAIMP